MFANTLTLLFENIARIVEEHQPFVETYYGKFPALKQNHLLFLLATDLGQAVFYVGYTEDLCLISSISSAWDTPKHLKCGVNAPVGQE